MNPLFSLLSLGLLIAAASTGQAAPDTRVYELRIYTVLPGRMPAMLARFRDHTCKLFEKHGMENIGYWTPMDAKDGAGEKLVYLLGYPSREAAKKSWAEFSKNPDWIAARTASEADGKIVAKVESTFLNATDYSPAIAVSTAGPRVFELRTYVTPAGKLPALHARFRDHTRVFFTHYGMTNIAYWVPSDADKGADHTLIYMLAHKNREAAAASFTAFRADPGWIKVKGDSERDGSLTTEIRSVFLTPTDFSPTK